MALKRWIGGAPAVKHTYTATPGTVAEGDIYTLSVAGREISYTADGDDDATAVCTALTSRWNASTVPHIAEATAVAATGYITISHDTAGKPFDLEAVASGAGTSEVQRIHFQETPTQGTWLITFDGETTSAIAYNASAATVEAALEPLSGIGTGNVSVSKTTQDGTPLYSITFAGALANQDVEAVTVESHARWSSVSAVLATTVEGANQVAEVQQYNFYGNPTGGTFTLSLGGIATAPIAYNANAATIHTAVDAAWGSTASGGATAVFDGTHPTLTITHGGVGKIGVDQPLMTLDPSGLSGVFGAKTQQLVAGSAPTVEIQDWKLAGNPTGGTWQFKAHGYWSDHLAATISTEDLNTAIGDFCTTHGLLTGWSQQFVASELGDQHWRITWQETSGNVAATELDDSALTNSTVGATVTVTSAATPATAQRTLIGFAGTPTSGTWTISLNGTSGVFVGASSGTTSSLAHNANAAAIQAALTAINPIELADVSVQTLSATQFYVYFYGRAAGDTWAVTTATTMTGHVEATVYTMQEAEAAIGDSTDLFPTGYAPHYDESEGGYTITVNGAPLAVPYDVPASTIQTNLQALTTVGANNVLVQTYNGNSFYASLPANTTTGGMTLQWQGALAGAAAPTVTIDDANLNYRVAGSAIEQTLIVAGVVGENEQQRLEWNLGVGNHLDYGTWTLTWNGNTTTALDYDATPSEVVNALAALSGGTGIAGSGSTTFKDHGDHLVLTYGGPLAQTNQPQPTANLSNLQSTGGTATITVNDPGTLELTRLDDITGDANVTSGTWILSFTQSGSTYTANCDYNSSTAGVLYQIQNSGSPYVGDATVTSNGSTLDTGAVYTVDWGSGSSVTSSVSVQPSLFGGDYFASLNQEYGPGEDGDFDLDITANGGTYQIDWLYDSTPHSLTLIAFDESASNLEGLFATENPDAGINVSGSAGAFNITHSPRCNTWSTYTIFLYKAPTLNITQVNEAVTEVLPKFTYQPTGTTAPGSVRWNYTPDVVHNISISAADLKTALTPSHSGIGDCTFTGGPWPGTPIAIEGWAQPYHEDAYCRKAAPITVTVNNTHVAAVPEIQYVDLRGTPQSGTWTISWGGNTTSSLAHNASPSTVQSALRALTGLSGVNVATVGQSYVYAVEFAGSQAGVDVAEATVNTDNLVTQVEPVASPSILPVPGTAEVQQIDFSSAPTGGTWSMNFGGNPTGSMAYNISAADMQALLRATPNIFGNIVVAKPSSTRYTLTWAGSEGLNPSDPTCDTSALGAAIAGEVTQVQTGVAPVWESFLINLSGTPTSGVWSINYGGVPKSLTYNTTAAEVQTAFRSLLGNGFTECQYATVTGAIPTFTVTLGGLTWHALRALSYVCSLSGQPFSLSGTTTVEAIAGASTQQTLTIDHDLHAGAITLSQDGETTQAIEPPITAASLKAAIVALGDWGSSDLTVTLSGDGTELDADHYATITYAGTKAYKTLAEEPAFTVASNTLIPTVTEMLVSEYQKGRTNATLTIVETQAATGPNHYSNVLNWEGGVLPVTGDDMVIDYAVVDEIQHDLDQSGTTLNSITIDSATAEVGLARTTENYPEYRRQFLRIGASKIVVRNCYGPVKIDTGSTQTELIVHASGTGESELAVQWQGTHASNKATINGGNVGLGAYRGQTSTLNSLKISGSSTSVTVGPDVTLTTVDKHSGTLTVSADITTLNQRGGRTTVQDADVGTLLALDGTLYFNSDGTITTATAGGRATLDFSQDARAKTITTLSMFGRATLNDPARTVTIVNTVPLDGGLEDVTLRLGYQVSLGI